MDHLYSELAFTVMTLKANGQRYEDIFGDVKIELNPEFRKIRPYGNVGDRKNDGFDPKTGTYFQVYAPENLAIERTIAQAVSKLEEDFTKLHNQWNGTIPISEFRFVLNDKFNGCPPDVELKLGELRAQYPDITFGSYTLNDLLNDFDELDDKGKVSIIGIIPSAEHFRTVPVLALQNAIKYLNENNDTDDETNEDFNIEEFENKIVFNHLNDEIALYLKKAETQSYILDDYFSANADKELKKHLRDLLKAVYNKEKRLREEFNAFTATTIFYKMIEACSPDGSTDSINSGMLLLSYYFISCDIYEKPPNN